MLGLGWKCTLLAAACTVLRYMKVHAVRVSKQTKAGHLCISVSSVHNYSSNPISFRQRLNASKPPHEAIGPGFAIASKTLKPHHLNQTTEPSITTPQKTSSKASASLSHAINNKRGIISPRLAEKK